MAYKPKAVQWLYRKLLSLYPRTFRDRFGESMAQTFDDLYLRQKRQSVQGGLGFVLWIFVETTIGIVREHLLLIFLGGAVQPILLNLGLSTLTGFLLIFPLVVMEIVNRRNFNEDFPFMLFFVLWLNLFAISLILLPIVRSRRKRALDLAKPVPTPGDTLLTNPKSAALISVGLFLFPILLFWLQSLGWEPLERLFNGPNPERPYLPGQVLSILLISIPVAAGLIAGGPITRSLQGGGSPFAHPLHLIIVVVILLLFTAGAVGMLVDQWPCFIGLPNCD